MAGLLGRRGHPGARAALRAAYDGTEGLLEDEILPLEGEEGFLWMASQLGRWARKGVEVGDYLVDTYARNAAGATLREARQAVAALLRAHSDPNVRYYVEYLQANSYGDSLGGPGKGATPLRHPKDAEEVVARLDELDREAFYLGPWTSRPDPAGLRRLSEELFRPMPLIRLRSLLRCFQQHGLPEYDPRMQDYAHHENAEVRRLSYWILGHHDHPDVRSLALARLRNFTDAPAASEPTEADGWPPTLEPTPLRPGTLESDTLRLFTSNWRAGDERLLLRALRDVPHWDAHRRHAVLSDLVDVLKPNSSPGRLPLLVYEHSPCTVCRSQVVELMRRLGALPAWVRRECRHDVGEHIRELARGDCVMRSA